MERRPLATEAGGSPRTLQAAGVRIPDHDAHAAELKHPAVARRRRLLARGHQDLHGQHDVPPVHGDRGIEWVRHVDPDGARTVGELLGEAGSHTRAGEGELFGLVGFLYGRRSSDPEFLQCFETIRAGHVRGDEGVTGYSCLHADAEAEEDCEMYYLVEYEHVGAQSPQGTKEIERKWVVGLWAVKLHFAQSKGAHRDVILMSSMRIHCKTNNNRITLRALVRGHQTVEHIPSSCATMKL